MQSTGTAIKRSQPQLIPVEAGVDIVFFIIRKRIILKGIACRRGPWHWAHIKPNVVVAQDTVEQWKIVGRVRRCGLDGDNIVMDILQLLQIRDRFSCKRDLIDCALMSIGDYGQQERNKWRYQYASKGMQIAWEGLFHKSANVGFDNTREILLRLLSKAESFTNEFLARIIAEFISSCEESSLYPWRYYYVKYASFRPGSYGKYSNKDVTNKPYLFSVMRTQSQWSSNTYMPYLKEADEPHLSRDSMGQRLVYGDRHIICDNSAYVLRENKTEEIVEIVPIRQNGNGIDTEDRILVLKRYIENMRKSLEDGGV